jgi:hypothetical protein
MGNPTDRDAADADDNSGESELRGSAAGHTADHKRRDPDTALRVNNEKDSLYTDGLELDDDTPPMGTDGRSQDNAR